MAARKSTLTNAFVSALIPRIEPTAEEIAEALTILALDPFDLRCAYCGNPYHTWDHLRPLVMDRRPTGYITEIANLVPACGPCNSSKGGSHWKTWMFGKAKGSPAFRGIAEVELRGQRLDSYERWRQPVKVDFAAILGDGDWQHYWSLCDAAITDLQAAQAIADRLKERVVATVKAAEAQALTPTS
jgi:hypothetical protein